MTQRRFKPGTTSLQDGSFTAEPSPFHTVQTIFTGYKQNSIIFRWEVDLSPSQVFEVHLRSAFTGGLSTRLSTQQRHNRYVKGQYLFEKPGHCGHIFLSCRQSNPQPKHICFAVSLLETPTVEQVSLKNSMSVRLLSLWAVPGR